MADGRIAVSLEGQTEGTTSVQVVVFLTISKDP